MTTDEVATLVNEGHLTLQAGNALLAEATRPPLNGNCQATYLVAIAIPAAADSRPAAAMKQFDATVDRATSAERPTTWSTTSTATGSTSRPGRHR